MTMRTIMIFMMKIVAAVDGHHQFHVAIEMMMIVTMIVAEVGAGRV